MICNLCSVKGHKAVDFPNKNKCRRCWETGHFARSCPNPWGRTAMTENAASEDFPDLSPTARSVDDPPPAPNSVDVILDDMCDSLGSDISNLSDNSLETVVSGAETINEDVTGSESILNTAAVDDYVADDFELYLEASGPGAEKDSNTLEDVTCDAPNNIGENDVVVVTPGADVSVGNKSSNMTKTVDERNAYVLSNNTVMDVSGAKASEDKESNDISITSDDDIVMENNNASHVHASSNNKIIDVSGAEALGDKESNNNINKTRDGTIVIENDNVVHTLNNDKVIGVSGTEAPDDRQSNNGNDAVMENNNLAEVMTDAPVASLDSEDLVAATSTPEGGALTSMEDFTFDDNLSEVSTYSLTGQVSDDASSVCSTNDAQILPSSVEDEHLSELAGKVKSFLSLSEARDGAHPVWARPRRSRRAKQT